MYIENTHISTYKEFPYLVVAFTLPKIHGSMKWCKKNPTEIEIYIFMFIYICIILCKVRTKIKHVHARLF